MRKMIDSFLRLIGLEFPYERKAEQTFVFFSKSLSNENLAVLAETVRNEVILRKQRGEMSSSLIPFIEDML